jgi:predicted transcriptional regulator
MYISTHTVAHHLRQAFRKLSIASRNELTRIVIEQAADGADSARLSTLRMQAACGAAILIPRREFSPKAQQERSCRL